MRLTLRTLLAYLDDTLEPAEAKLIGQKVAESEAAQELVARIREVTRRRRITTPPDTPGAKFDPNSIAEYLDNELTAESLAELEQTALASDVHLAEVAACHQILTVVLGEPAAVPPSAYKRMYGLVKSPESNPRHLPPKRRELEPAIVEGREVDETLRLGLPAFRGGNWTNGLILAGGAACALLLLALALWQVLPTRHENSTGEGGSTIAKAPDTKKTVPIPAIDSPAKKDIPGKDKEPDKLPEAKEKPPDKEKAGEIKDKQPDKDKPADVKDKKPAEDAPLPPDPAVRVLGHFEPVARDPAVLLQLVSDKKQPDRKQWTRLSQSPNQPASSEILSNCPLVSLPGYRSVVKMDSGVKLTLWGSLLELSRYYPPALESVATLHPNDQFDLDLTLARGRVSLVNTKDQPVKIRLRFANPTSTAKPEVWDITLVEKGSEVIVNLFEYMQPGDPFYVKRDDPERKGPIAQVDLLANTGTAELRIDLQASSTLKPPPAGRVVVWNSRGGAVTTFPVDAMPPWVQPLPPLPKDADPKFLTERANALAALDNLSADLSGALDVGLANATKTNDMFKRRLVVRAAAAMDDLQRLMDYLEDKEPELRQEAISSLRSWIGAARDNDYKLFDQLQPAYNANDATIVLELLHGFTPAQAAEPNTHSLLVSRLTHKKLAIRELAHQYLIAMFPSGRSINFNAAATEPQLRQYAGEWDKLVKKGK